MPGLHDSPNTEPPGRVSRLTPRERQIVAYLAAGKPNKVIAIDLGISLRTAEAHRARIFRKLGVRNILELACHLCVFAQQGAAPAPRPGLFQPEPPARVLAESLPLASAGGTSPSPPHSRCATGGLAGPGAGPGAGSHA